MIDFAPQFVVSGWRRILAHFRHPSPSNPRKSDHPIDFIVLSFPRSGNHWVRYIIEWFSGRPTLGAGEGEHENDFVNPIDTPIGARVSIPHLVLDASPIAKKRHRLTPWDSREANLLLIVRNYKESVVRQLQLTPGWSGRLSVQDKAVAGLLQDYWELIHVFDGWRKHKHLTYYEDLVQSPQRTIEALLAYMGISATSTTLGDFFSNYSWHKQNSISALVDPSATRGESTVSHTRLLSDEQKHAWDEFLREKDQELFERYLKRYQEHAA